MSSGARPAFFFFVCAGRVGSVHLGRGEGKLGPVRPRPAHVVWVISFFLFFLFSFLVYFQIEFKFKFKFDLDIFCN